MTHDPPDARSRPALARATLDLPRHTTPPRDWGHYLAAFVLRLGGWKIGSAPPVLDKYVIVAAPHTAWADGFWMLSFAWYWGQSISWMGKSQLNRGAWGWFLRRVGIIPVDRSGPHGLVGFIVDEFARRDKLLLSIPPEGTRARRPLWKSGFYHIARQADVPVCLSYLDYRRREAGFGPVIQISGDVRQDMSAIREFYEDITAKVPKLFTPPRLREEGDVTDQPGGSV
ncbi:MAG: 1-acyl-sn-glycerol-3-phosphate acyltransferase [Myxococcales bacterium]|nr:1-acyl-sn-glycerol-3-phosphate acyltransferase [Myxococcales bacterium]MCB9754936.1 1-acyl-sn-glycerol-3-phosphate acyltransferase [Myxococcales bacterium]